MPITIFMLIIPAAALSGPETSLVAFTIASTLLPGLSYLDPSLIMIIVWMARNINASQQRWSAWQQQWSE